MTAQHLDEAIRRMREAMERLETAIDIRRRQDSRRVDSDEEFSLMQDDRARLAVELDGALADSKSLATANAAAASAIGRAASAIEDLLARASE